MKKRIMLTVFLLVLFAPEASAFDVQLRWGGVATPGQNNDFNIWVYPDPDRPIRFVSAELEYDPNLLQVNGISEGDLLKKEGANTFFLKGDFSSPGKISRTSTSILGMSGVATPGIWIVINVTILKSAPNYGVNIKDLMVRDENRVFLAFPTPTPTPSETPTPPIPTPAISPTTSVNEGKSGGGGSPGGGGGGGGGGPSGENATNILVAEKYDFFIYKDKETLYNFSHKDSPVRTVAITGNVSAGEVRVMVEVLKSNSTLMKDPPPGVVYRNVNVWVGTSEFAVPRNIKEAKIQFRVPKPWFGNVMLKEDDVRLLKGEKGRWVQLETRRVDEDSSYVYYESYTSTFSPFAIVGLRRGETAKEVPTAPPMPSTTTLTSTPILSPTPERVVEEKISTVGLLLAAAIILGVRWVWGRKSNSRKERVLDERMAEVKKQLRGR